QSEGRDREEAVREREQHMTRSSSTGEMSAILIQNFLEKILMKILSYLDAPSLFCISHVNRLFHQLANDEFSVIQVILPKNSYIVGNWTETVAGQEINKWRKELKNISPYTGLPRQTEFVLRYVLISLSWGLAPQNTGKELHITSKSPPAGLLNCFPSYPRPQWQSLIFELDTKTCDPQVIGKDKLMKLLHLSPGVIIGIWRCCISFIMISLHLHRLVEKSLLGSPACPYSEVLKQPCFSSDPELGLHGYTLHFVLHNTNTEIMAGSSRHLLCRTVTVFRSNPERTPGVNSDRRDKPNCCVMTMTLMDEFQKPFWCVSSPVSIRMVEEQQSSHYSGEHFMMDYSDSDGKVKMELEWLKEEKQFFLIGLTIHISLLKIKQHFGRSY
uniref:F-box only protein 15-like n=1 Tax=Cynoglossus semilaevis TaxID=244447 RepID=A0A3P8V270_CYNSE